MSVRKSTDPAQVPNWIAENDWSPEARIDWMRQIMAFSPRSWGEHPHAVPGAADPETWAVYCLVMCNTAKDALKKWNVYCFPGLFPDDDNEGDE
jgi:hypothetical protein